MLLLGLLLLLAAGCASVTVDCSARVDILANRLCEGACVRGGVCVEAVLRRIRGCCVVQGALSAEAVCSSWFHTVLGATPRCLCLGPCVFGLLRERSALCNNRPFARGVLRGETWAAAAVFMVACALLHVMCCWALGVS
jgi:hypothetical protein